MTFVLKYVTSVEKLTSDDMDKDYYNAARILLDLMKKSMAIKSDLPSLMTNRSFLGLWTSTPQNMNTS